MSVNFTLSTDVPSDERKTFTITLIGDSGVGKSTVACRLLKQWNELCIISKTKGRKKDKFDVVAKDFNVTLLNTTRLTMDRALPKSDVYVLVYSIVGDGSFKSVCDARELLIQRAGNKIPILFVGNKTDISGSVDVMKRSSRNFVITVMMGHCHEEISAETDPMVQPLLEEILTISLRKCSKLDSVENNVQKHAIENDKYVPKDQKEISKMKKKNINNIFHFKRK